MKKCPLCLKQKSKFTKEHLPFKALYKGLGVKDNPAIIKICRYCNQTKSIWDQEILAPPRWREGPLSCQRKLNKRHKT